jgi:hypothetical protein
MEEILNKRNLIIGTIISLIIGSLSYTYIKNSDSESVTKKDRIDKKIPEINLDNIFNDFSREMRKATKNIYKMNMRSSQSPEQLSIRNNLFRKEVNIKRIVIDSKDIHHISNYNTSNYIVNLINKSGLSGGTIGRITNIINFKLVSCIIPTPPWNVTNNNNKLIINVNGSNNTITLTKDKNYTYTELATELQNKLSVIDNSFTVNYSNSKYTISVNSPGTFYFKWMENFNVNNSSAYKLFGFELRDYSSGNTITSDKIPDFVQYHVDLVIPELPPKNTISTIHNYNTLERIPLSKTCDLDMVIYNNVNITSYSHFFPISLDKITIKLFDTNCHQLYDCGNKDNSFVFEYVELLNTSLMNQK